MTRRLVNNTADEFDELVKLSSYNRRPDDDWQALDKKEKELILKAFADLAYIFDELCCGIIKEESRVAYSNIPGIWWSGHS